MDGELNLISYHLIHCEKHSERLEHIDSVISKLGFPVHIFNGIYVSTDFSSREEVLSFCKSYDPNFRSNQHLVKPRGAIGAYLSHHLLIKYISENITSKYSVIFEDDIILDETTHNKLIKIINDIEDTHTVFDICYLTNPEKNHGVLIKDNLYFIDKDKHCFSTAGLLINNASIPKIYDRNLDVKHEIDTQYAMCSNLNILVGFPSFLKINYKLKSNIRPW